MQAILDCADASYDRYDENRDVWTTIRGHCKGLLGEEDYYRYYELCEEEVFDFIYKVEDNRLIEWKNLLDRFNPEDEDVRSSDYEAEIAFRDDFEDNSKVMRERVIAYHQLEAFSLYLKDKPAQTAAYHEFLVSVLFYGACMHFYFNDNNLTPLFCRWTTVARQPRDWRLVSHWCLRLRGYSSRLRRGISMWKLPRLQGAGVETTTTTTTTTIMTTTTVIKNRRVVASSPTIAQSASESHGVSPSNLDLSNWSGGEVGATIAMLHPLPMIRKAMTLLSANSVL